MKEVKSRYKVDTCGLQEVRRISASARLVEGKDSRYSCSGYQMIKAWVVVGILLAEKWVEAIFDVKGNAQLIQKVTFEPLTNFKENHYESCK